MEIASQKWQERHGPAREWYEHSIIAQAYADDQLVLISGRSAKEIQTIWDLVWEECKNWESKSGSKYNLKKTETLLIEKDGKKIRPPTIKTDGHTITIGHSIKYLGVTVDRQLNFNEHVRNVRRKSERVANKLISLTRRQYGRNSSFIKIITNRVMAPAILYASEVWGAKAGQVFNMRQLDAAQRPFLRAMVKAYKTTPTAALQVLSGTAPWWIEARVRYDEHWTNVEEIEKAHLDREKLMHPTKARQMTTLSTCERKETCSIYCDASIGAVTGFGFLKALERGTIFERESLYEEHILDADQAETLAVWLALERNKEIEGDMYIFTDRLEVARRFAEGKATCNNEVDIWICVQQRLDRGYMTRVAWVRRDNEKHRAAHEQARKAARRQGVQVDVRDLVYKKKHRRKWERKRQILESWQSAWDEGKTGRPCHMWCREVGFDDLKVSFKTAQLVTGHGNFREYIRRFKLAETDGLCSCNEVLEDVQHVRWHCGRQDRVEARRRVMAEHGNLEVRMRINNERDERQLSKIGAWAEEVIDEEDYRHEAEEESEEDLTDEG